MTALPNRSDAAAAHLAFVTSAGEARLRDPSAVHDSCHVVGGRVLRLRVAGLELGRVLSRAFIPAGADAEPELTVDLWDQRATGAGRPSSAVEDAQAALDGPGERVDWFEEGRFVRSGSPGMSVWCDREEGRAAGWVQSVGELSDWTLLRPLQQILGAWLPALDVRLVHAAAVARAGRALLLPGPNGVGKSTSSIAAVCGGLCFLGDDAVALERTPGGDVVAHGVHGVGKFASARFPGLARRAGTPVAGEDGPPESSVYLQEVFRERVVPSATAVAIAFPELSSAADTRWLPMPPGRALERLLRCTLSPEHGRVRDDFAFLSGIVDRLPCFRLEVGRETEGVPVSLAALLDHAGT